MPVIPQRILENRRLIPGLELLNTGKVRERFRLQGWPGFSLFQTTRRLSALDVILPVEIPFKDEVLNGMTVFWKKMLAEAGFITDLAAAGVGIDGYLTEPLRGDPRLQATCVVTTDLEMLSVEAVVRGFLAGSGLKSYKADHTVCGHLLRPGLRDGDDLDYPIYTPTTKATEGHDEAMYVDEAAKLFGFEVERRTLQIYMLAKAYARGRDIVIADTKLEFGLGDGGRLRLGDEVLTPDSSRFWPYDGWLATRAEGKTPPSLDKDPIRVFLADWCDAHGIKKMDPKNPDHVRLIHETLVLPEDVISATTKRYRYIFWRLTGNMLERFQRDAMGIKVDLPKRKVLVLVGSESDNNQTVAGMEYLIPRAHGEYRVLSCHRHTAELDLGTAKRFLDFDVVIAGAGMANQLPGTLKARLCMHGRPDIAVVGVAFKGKTEKDDLAAKLSIERLPGQPVEMDSDGKAYFGHEGFLQACEAAVNNEFLSRSYGTKPSKTLATF